MKNKVINFLKTCTLEDKIDVLNNILWDDKTFFYLHSDKKKCGFDVPIDMKAEYPTRDAGLNGLSIQINVDLDKAEMTVGDYKKKIKLNSFKIN